MIDVGKMVGIDESYEDLANAIILSAVRDYKRALIHLERNPDNESAKREIERGERFFYSSWFEMLTDLHPDYLVRKLKETVKEQYGNHEGR